MLPNRTTKLTSKGAYPGETLHEIECDSLGLKKGLGIPLNGENSSVCANPVSIAVMKCYGKRSGPDASHRDCAGRTGQVVVTGTLGTRSSVVFDLDGDGDLDIVTNEFNAAPQLLLSDLADRHAIDFLQIRLVGTESNRDGLGARVEVTAGGQTLVRYHDGKSGYLAQSSFPLYFGLPPSGRVERVVVHWPSGRTQALEGDIQSNTTLTIVEGPTARDLL